MSYLSPEDLGRLGVRAGRGSKVSVDARIFGGDRITLGENTRIDAFCVISAGADGYVTIGSHIHIASGVRIFGEGGVTIDDFSSISAGTTLYSASDDYSGEHLIGPTIDRKFLGLDVRPITLERFASLGAHCLVLPGVHVGEGAVLGVCGLARDNLEEWTMNVGIPARMVRSRSRRMIELADQFAAEWAQTK